MRKSFAVTLVVVTTLGLGATRPALGGEFRPAAEQGVKNHYLVVLEEGVARRPDRPLTGNSPSIGMVAAELARTGGGKVLRTWEHALSGFLVEMPEQAARRLARHPWVRWVEQDAPVELAAVANCSKLEYFRQPSGNPTSPQSITCPDPTLDCKDNWGLDRIDQRSGRDGTFHFSATGAGVHVYLLDTGIDRFHQEFRDASGRSRIGEGINFASNDPREVFNLTLDNIDPFDTSDCTSNGHGTHVAAIAGGRRYGVAKGVTLHPIRAWNCHARTTNAIVTSAVDWIAARHQKPAIVNISANSRIGNSGPEIQEFNALEAAFRSLIVEYGVTVVNSAGNSDADANAFVPTRMEEAIVVAGSDFDMISGHGIDDFRWPTSNWGEQIDFFAPAADIVSAARDSFNGEGACRLSGTSMAAPHATGVAALYMQTHPQATPAEVEAALIDRASPGELFGFLGEDVPNLLLFSNL